MASVENNPLDFASQIPHKSLAQSIRSKELKQARGILIVVGVLTFLVNGGFLMMAKSNVDQEIDKQVKQVQAQHMQVDLHQVELVRASALTLTYLIQGGAAALGIVFIVLGFLVKSYPVPATMLGLILYLAGTAIFGYLEPMTLLQGIIFKMFIVISLFASIKAAIGYQKHLARNAVAA
ncbi:MAG TPA: hypothetical protein VHY91_16245 [Pirellulales bacterium]|jgi:uncharacterized membrane protein|nr:hypothetical protein [Pirellulales bacterium]